MDPRRELIGTGGETAKNERGHAPRRVSNPPQPPYPHLAMFNIMTPPTLSPHPRTYVPHHTPPLIITVIVSLLGLSACWRAAASSRASCFDHMDRCRYVVGGLGGLKGGWCWAPSPPHRPPPPHGDDGRGNVCSLLQMWYSHNRDVRMGVGEGYWGGLVAAPVGQHHISSSHTSSMLGLIHWKTASWDDHQVISLLSKPEKSETWNLILNLIPNDCHHGGGAQPSK